MTSANLDLKSTTVAMCGDVVCEVAVRNIEPFRIHEDGGTSSCLISTEAAASNVDLASGSGLQDGNRSATISSKSRIEDRDCRIFFGVDDGSPVAIDIVCEVDSSKSDLCTRTDNNDRIDFICSCGIVE